MCGFDKSKLLLNTMAGSHHKEVVQVSGCYEEKYLEDLTKALLELQELPVCLWGCAKDNRGFKGKRAHRKREQKRIFLLVDILFSWENKDFLAIVDP